MDAPTPPEPSERTGPRRYQIVMETRFECGCMKYTSYPEDERPAEGQKPVDWLREKMGTCLLHDKNPVTW